MLYSFRTYSIGVEPFDASLLTAKDRILIFSSCFMIVPCLQTKFSLQV